MARNRVSSGLSISDITKMSMEQFEKYTPGQQREIVSRLASAANKRFKNLQNRGIVSPASIRLSQSGGKVSVRGKSGVELQMEMTRAKQFLNSSLSTTKGYKKLQNDIKEEERRINAGYSENEKNDTAMGLAFAYYDILYEQDPTIANIRQKYEIVEHIADQILEGKSGDDIINNTMSWLETKYIENQKQYNDNNISFSNAIENDIPQRYRR